MNLKETLSFYRKQQGLSQIELAEALEVSRQTVSKWETGAALPSAENLLALSKLYGIPADALLNGGGAEPAPVVTELPAAPLPDPEGFAPPRRRLVLEVLGVTILFDLVIFLMDFYLGTLTGGGGVLCPVLRILGCALIGLAFAWRDQGYRTDRKRSLFIGLAFLGVGLYAFLIPIPLLWRLYDLVAWIGTPAFDAALPSNPLFFFLGWTLADQYAFSSHMLLISLFHLGRLRLSRKSTTPPQSVQPV